MEVLEIEKRVFFISSGGKKIEENKDLNFVKFSKVEMQKLYSKNYTV